MGSRDNDQVQADYEGARELLSRHFSELDEKREDVWVETYEPKQVIFRRGEGTDRVWFIRRGIIDEWRGDVRLARLGAGDLLGNVMIYSPPPGGRVTTAICVTGAEVVSMPTVVYIQMTFMMDGREGRLALRKLLRHAGHWVEGVTKSMNHLTHQRFARQRSTLIPPDYLAYPADMHCIPCQLPDALRRELPPWVNIAINPGEPPSCLLIMSHYGELRPRRIETHGERLDFSEAMVLIPVVCADGERGYYQAWSFPNNALSMFKAREVFGQPKMFGNTYIEPLLKAHEKTDENAPVHEHELWRISGRSGGSMMVDLRIRYCAWQELGDRMLPLLQRVFGTEGAKELTKKEFNAHCKKLKARVKEYAKPANRTRGNMFEFAWHREGDPTDHEWWKSFLHTAGQVWLGELAKGKADPLTWALEWKEERIADVVQSRSRLSSELEAGPAAVAALYKFLPESLRTQAVLSWKRNFTPEVATTENYMEWNPDDFAVDGIARNFVTTQRMHSLDLFEIDEDLITFRVGPRLLDFRPLIRGPRSGQRGSGCHGFRVVGDVLMRASLDDDGPALEIDYLERQGELMKPANSALRRKLAWGPAVWSVEGSEPAAGVPRTPVEELQPLIPAQLSPGDQPGFEGVATLLEAAVKALDDSQKKRGVGFGPPIPAPPPWTLLREVLRGLVGSDPKLIWLRENELLHGMGDDRDIAWLVVDGALEEWNKDTWLGRREPGVLCGERLVLGDMKRIVEVRAVTDCAVLAVPGERLRQVVEDTPGWFHYAGFLSYFSGIEAVESALEACYQLDVTSYQFFPGARAVVLPGPYKANNIEMAVIPIQRPTDGWIEKHMPPDVQWATSIPFAILMIARFEDFGPAEIELDTGGGAAYTETGLLLPAMVDGKLQGFIPWIFPSNIAAMFAGRELYGYPKTYANTVFDDRFNRLVLRRRGVTAMSIKYSHRDWGEIAIAEALHLMKTLGQVWSLPWSADGGDFDSPAYDPPKDQTSILPWFGFLGPYMEAAGRLLPALPEFLRTMPVACWKRNFSSGVRYPGSHLIAKWRSKDFDVDQVAGSGFIVTGLSEAHPIRIDEPDGIEMIYAGETDLDPDDEGHVTTFWPLGCLGLWCKYDMSMTTGEELIDYRKHAAAGEPRLEFGPKARSET